MEFVMGSVGTKEQQKNNSDYKLWHAKNLIFIIIIIIIGELLFIWHCAQRAKQTWL